MSSWDWPGFMNRHHLIREAWGPISWLRLSDRRDFTVGGVCSVLAAVLLTSAAYTQSSGLLLAAILPTLVALLFWKDHIEQLFELRRQVAAASAKDGVRTDNEAAHPSRPEDELDGEYFGEQGDLLSALNLLTGRLGLARTDLAERTVGGHGLDGFSFSSGGYDFRFQGRNFSVTKSDVDSNCLMKLSLFEEGEPVVVAMAKWELNEEHPIAPPSLRARQILQRVRRGTWPTLLRAIQDDASQRGEEILASSHFVHSVDDVTYQAWFRLIPPNELKVIGAGMRECVPFDGGNPELAARSALEQFVRRNRR